MEKCRKNKKGVMSRPHLVCGSKTSTISGIELLGNESSTIGSAVSSTPVFCEVVSNISLPQGEVLSLHFRRIIVSKSGIITVVYSIGRSNDLMYRSKNSI